jgi:hypothetical protein
VIYENHSDCVAQHFLSRKLLKAVEIRNFPSWINFIIFHQVAWVSKVPFVRKAHRRLRAVTWFSTTKNELVKNIHKHHTVIRNDAASDTVTVENLVKWSME